MFSLSTMLFSYFVLIVNFFFLSYAVTEHGIRLGWLIVIASPILWLVYKFRNTNLQAESFKQKLTGSTVMILVGGLYFLFGANLFPQPLGSLTQSAVLNGMLFGLSVWFYE